MSEDVRSADGDGPSADPVFPQANFVAVQAIAGALATTYGPLSNDKLVVTRLATREEPKPGQLPTDEFVVTNDGATVLEELDLQHPVAPVLRRFAGPARPGTTDVEGQDIPDGVTGTTLLAGALLDEAETLIDLGVHPQSIREGFHAAQAVALDALADETRPLDSFPDGTAARHAVARTAMTGNDVGAFRDVWAQCALDAVGEVGMPTERSFVVRQVEDGAIADSELVRGAVLDRNGRASDEMPGRVEDATVLVLDGQDDGGLRDVELREPFRERLTVRPDSPDAIGAFADHDAARRERIVDRLVEAGVDVVVARQGIEEPYQRLLADRGILGVRGVSRLDLFQVASATGAAVVKKTEGFAAADLGRAGVVEERVIEPYADRRKRRRMLVFGDCPDPASVAVLLRGVAGQVADQATVEVRKAAAAFAAADGCAGHRPGVVPGAGAIDVRLADRVRTAAFDHHTRAQLAAEAYATALVAPVRALAANAGRDPITTLADLRAAHADGETAAGLVLPDGQIGDALEAGVLEPAAVRHRQLVAATEVASLLLRVDDAIDATFETELAGPGESVYDDVAEQHMPDDE